MSFSSNGRLRSCLVLALGAAALTTLVHCTSAGEDGVGAAESEHNEGDPTNENSAYSWAETDFESFLKTTSRVGPGAELPQDSPITVRLQKWVDAYDAAARAITRENTGQELAAPHPYIVVYNSATNNAWAASTSTCLGGPVDLSGIPTPGTSFSPPIMGVGDAGAPPTITKLSLSGNAVTFGQGACVEPKNWPSKVGATKWLERHKDPSQPWTPATPCRYEWRGDRLAVVGASADPSAPYNGCYAVAYYRPADLTNLEAVTSRSSQYIYMTTRILQTLPDEKAVAMVIAHELAHFYKAHGSRHGRYGYFYEQKTPALPGKPAPVADTGDLESRLRELSPYYPVAIPGTLMSERLRPLILDLAAAMQNGFSPPRAADAAPLDASCTGLYSGIAPYVNELRIPGARPSEAAIAKYLEVEKQLVSCAAVTKIGATDQIPYATMQSLVVRSFNAAMALVPTPAPGQTLPSKTLADLLGELQGKAKELDFDTTAFHAAVVARHLGIYTSEQEADDLGMELMTKTGFGAAEVTDAWARWMESRLSDPAQAGAYASDGIDPKECLSLYRSGWKKADANGVMQSIAIPLGNLHSAHHGHCYRLYNLTREHEAHAHATAGTIPTFETPWSEIRAAVDAAYATLPAAPAAPTTPPATGFDADELGIVDSF